MSDGAQLKQELALTMQSHPEVLWHLHCNGVDLQVLDKKGARRPMVDVVLQGLLPPGTPQPSTTLRQYTSKLITDLGTAAPPTLENNALAPVLSKAHVGHVDATESAQVCQAWGTVHNYLDDSLRVCGLGKGIPFG
jgi:hypothetical protein